MKTNHLFMTIDQRLLLEDRGLAQRIIIFVNFVFLNQVKNKIISIIINHNQ